MLTRPKLMAILWVIAAGCFGAAAVLITGAAQAKEGTPLHPTFELLDGTGANVLTSSNPVSTMQTCGACHDTTFIASHSFHVDVGLSEPFAPGSDGAAHPWDTGPGYFGRWNPITYRYLSPPGDMHIDLTTAAWIETFGVRHVGGGPETTSRDGVALPDSSSILDTGTVDEASGELVSWNWQESGVSEMNCFLCHTETPNNEARIAALQAGKFAWASTATLLGSGIVEQNSGQWEWNAQAFDAEGRLLPQFVTVQDPRSENCGQCHGVVQTDAQTPLMLDAPTSSEWTTMTTGQVISPQRISNSGSNLEDKQSLTRSWDVHAERVVACVDCHYSLNNPIYYTASNADQPEHLTFDPRRLDLGEYILRPLHQLATGINAQSGLAPEFDNTLRGCDSCHDAQVSHTWLPYTDRHMSALSCETCHVPHLYGPALQSVDWTVLNTDSSPQTVYRGTDNGQWPEETTLVTGFDPVLLPRENADGTTSLAPFNLVTAWYWVYGDPARPVPLRDLQAAYLDGDSYHADVLATFDVNGNGTLDESEQGIDSAEKEALIAARLVAVGLANPHIVGEVQPYSIHHSVTGEWATRECSVCHSEDSRISQPIALANYIPGGVIPTFMGGPGAVDNGVIATGDGTALYFQPANQSPPTVLYIFGHDSVELVDTLGMLIFLGTLTGAVIHGGLRYYAARRQAAKEPELRQVYMYTVYERLWHWLQTAVILGLIFTGLVIHKPDKFSVFSFRYIVEVHNILALILVINAALAAFYHLASGEIRQFLPEPHGFFHQAILQARYYLRGIFRREPHPFEKVPQRKLNPLQQITYLAILNILLPLQVITGTLMWGTQRWPDTAQSLGGLAFLAPFHTLIAWLFASFVVLHVYLTTTGHAPLADIRAMMMGWEDIEVHHASLKEEVSS